MTTDLIMRVIVIITRRTTSLDAVGNHTCTLRRALQIRGLVSPFLLSMRSETVRAAPPPPPVDLLLDTIWPLWSNSPAISGRRIQQ